MKNTMRVMFLALSLVSCGQSQSDSQIQELQKNIEGLQNDIAGLRAEMSDMKAETKVARLDVKDRAEEINQLYTEASLNGEDLKRIYGWLRRFCSAFSDFGGEMSGRISGCEANQRNANLDLTKLEGFTRISMSPRPSEPSQ